MSKNKNRDRAMNEPCPTEIMVRIIMGIYNLFHKDRGLYE